MKGLELSHEYFEKVAAGILKERFPEYFTKMAFGLAGEGSECWRFDDEISRDHDWGAGFCIWLSEGIYKSIGESVQKAYLELPEGGYPRRKTSTFGDGRTGAMTSGGFFFKFLGMEKPPEDNLGWLKIPEEGLSAATNGEVFLDESGDFTALRNAFLSYYPEPVRRKKIAAKAAKAAQSGQYNYTRCLRRGDMVACGLAKAEFCRAAMETVFLLNRHYAPYYKWLCRAIEELPRLSEMAGDFKSLMTPKQSGADNARIIEDISAKLIAELRVQGLSRSGSDFLLDHSLEVFESIDDPALRTLHFAV